MIWLVLAAVGVAVAIWLGTRRRHTKVAVMHSQPVSTIHGTRARNLDPKKKAALDAATASLR